MKKALHLVLKTLYLVLASATMPLAIWHLAPQFGAHAQLQLGLIIGTYLYAPLWLMLFIPVSIYRFPLTLKGAALAVLAPLLNLALIAFFHHEGFSNLLPIAKMSSANYFQATTIAITFWCVYILRKAFAEKHQKAVKQAAGAAALLTGLYAVMINYQQVSFLAGLNSLQQTISQSFVYVVTAFIASHSLMQMVMSESSNKEQSEAYEKAWKPWLVPTIIMLFVSALASLFVAGQG